MAKKKDTAPKGYDQRVSVEDNWLTDWNGTFVKVIHLPIGEEWAECTNEEKEAWEDEHKPIEPADNGGNGGNNGDDGMFE